MNLWPSESDPKRTYWQGVVDTRLSNVETVIHKINESVNAIQKAQEGQNAKIAKIMYTISLIVSIIYLFGPKLIDYILKALAAKP